MKRAITLLLSMVLVLGLILPGIPAVNAESTLTISEEGIEYIKKEEGFSKVPYWDYGQYTVGYGTKCPDDMLEEYKKNGITEEEAETLLKNHLAGIELVLNKKLIEKHELKLSQNQFDALVSFTYNLGTSWIYKTDSIFFNAIKNGATGSTLIRAFTLYSKAGGSVLSGLVRRRLCEANIYLNAEYSRTRPDNFGYVFLEPNGGIVDYTVQGYDTGEGATIAETPSYADHKFMGWYTAQTGGKKVTKLTASHVGDTLYARWDTEEGILPDKIDPVKVTVTGNQVNLRKGAGTNYTVVGSANAGDQLTVKETSFGTGYTWGNTEKGWIALKYTNYDDVVKGTTPTEPTTAPTEPTTAPTEPTTAPTEPTTAPTEPTTAPTEPTTAPTEPTTKPTEPTTAPTEPATKPTEPKPTEPEEKKITGTVRVSDVLFVRSGPGTGYKIVDSLKNGTKVTILEKKTVGHMDWGKISKGWISLTYVKLDEDKAETKPTEPKPTEPKPETTAKTGTVTADMLRIRKNAGTTYAITGYLYWGDKVTITATKKVGSTTWGQVSKGWISMDYVKLDGDKTETKPTEPAPTEPKPTEPKPTEPETTKTQTGTVKVNDYLTIRSGAGTSYKAVGRYYNGTKITILDTKKVGSVTWGKTNRGWVSLAYVTLDKTSEGETDAPVVKTITADCLRVRKSASTSAAIVGYLYRGAKVEILEMGANNWGRISTGWISLDYTK